jgi:hypothetical protein
VQTEQNHRMCCLCERGEGRKAFMWQPGSVCGTLCSLVDCYQCSGLKMHQHLSVTGLEMCVTCRCLPMSEYEELQLLNQLRRVPSMGDVPGAVRRLYRKLCVRRLKRERGMPLFNLDDIRPGRPVRKATRPVHPPTDVRILDRFQVKR